MFLREQTRRKNAIVRDIASTEGSLGHALREEVINHVIGLYPYFFFKPVSFDTDEIYLILQVIGP